MDIFGRPSLHHVVQICFHTLNNIRLQRQEKGITVVSVIHKVSANGIGADAQVQMERKRSQFMKEMKETRVMVGT